MRDWPVGKARVDADVQIVAMNLPSTRGRHRPNVSGQNDESKCLARIIFFVSPREGYTGAIVRIRTRRIAQLPPVVGQTGLAVELGPASSWSTVPLRNFSAPLCAQDHER